MQRMHASNLRALADDCVHCGFCLPACPTYLLWGREADSPRGRIYLMKASLDGRTSIDRGFTQHSDACLGGRGWVTASPSGEKYDRLIKAMPPNVKRKANRT